MSGARLAATLLAAGVGSWAPAALAYPVDQAERTGIRRLGWQRDVDAGAKRGRKLPVGAQWPDGRVTLKMLGARDYRLTAETPKDPLLQAGLEKILRRADLSGMNVALLDISDPGRPRYAAVRETLAQTPGSVAKVLIAAALLRELKRRFPDDIGAREAFLRAQQVTADDWAMPNTHEVPVIDGDSVAVRPVRRGDRFTLWEWADHTLSASSNAAASMLWREVTLMGLLGADYPPKAWDEELWARFDRQGLSEAAFRAVDAPLFEAGLDPEAFKLRLFFTHGAGRYIAGAESRVTPLALLQWLLAVEQGRMVDEPSSLELKRLLYLTRRRVRYAKAPVLADAAIFFKSGSLWQCKPEPGYTCTAYQGNAVNVLNALVEVETAPPPLPAAEPGAPAASVVTAAPPGAATGQAAPTPAVATGGETSAAASPPERSSLPPTSPAPERPLVYIVAVLSNALRRDSAEDHAKLAGYVHELVQRR